MDTDLEKHSLWHPPSHVWVVVAVFLSGEKRRRNRVRRRVLRRENLVGHSSSISRLPLLTRQAWGVGNIGAVRGTPDLGA